MKVLWHPDLQPDSGPREWTAGYVGDDGFFTEGGECPPLHEYFNAVNVTGNPCSNAIDVLCMGQDVLTVVAIVRLI